MATIGKFEKSENTYTGEINTLSLRVADVRITPEQNRQAPNSPSHRIFCGETMIGAAWTKTAHGGHAYLNCKIDDPSFSAPVYAILVRDEGAEHYSMVWSRPSGRAAEI